MIEQITFTELEKVLDVLPTEVAVLVVGQAGIGKSAFIKAWAQKQQTRYYEKNCAELLDIGDMLGRTSVANGRTVLNPPAWYSATEPTILVLDEINRAGANSILRGCMGLSLNRAIDELKLPEGSRIIAAANPDMGTIYDVIPFDLAQTNRFFVAELKSDPDYWLNNVAIPGHFNDVVVRYIKKYPTYLHQMSDDNAVSVAQSAKYYRNVLATPRSWDSFSRTLNNIEASLQDGELPPRRLIEIAGAGFIGPTLAAGFATFYIESRSTGIMDAEQLLTRNGLTTDAHDALMSAFKEMAENDVTRTCSVLVDIHKYLSGDGVKKLDNRRTAIPIAENYYKIMQACSSELRRYVYKNHLTAMYMAGESYIAKLIAYKRDIRFLFEEST